ncbi:MAG: hypothetical protein CMH58_07330 [Myxococcales bacterium]|nr:hypothetical protein [Myxococcales bacterium]
MRFAVAICLFCVGTPALATGAIYTGDTVRDRARAGASVASERSVSALSTNPGLLGKTDNFELQLSTTWLSDRSEITRKGPFTTQAFRDDNPDLANQLDGTMNSAAFASSLGKATSAYSTQLLRLGVSYGFGTSGFRIAGTLSDLPVQNHQYDTGGPVRYRLIGSDDRVRQISAGLGWAGRSFGIGAAVHINRVRRASRVMLSAADREALSNNGLYLERAFDDYVVDAVGTLQHSPQAGFGLWLAPFGKMEIGFAMQLASEGTSEAGDAQLDVSAISTEQSGAIFARTRPAAEPGIPSTVAGNAASIRDGLPMRIRAGFRYQFERWDLEAEWRMEQWSGATLLGITANSIPGSVFFIPDPTDAQNQVPLGDFGDGSGRSFLDAQSYHVASRIWLLPDGIALHVGYAMENPATEQPDAAWIDGLRHNIGVGLSLIDRGYAIDAGYLMVLGARNTIENGNLKPKNPRLGEAPDPAETDQLTVQNNGDYQMATSFFGLGLRADVGAFRETKAAERKAWYRVWTKGAPSFGRGGL